MTTLGYSKEGSNTIAVHGRNPGHHTGLHKEVFRRDNQEITDETLAQLSPTEGHKLKNAAKEKQCEEYLTCLLLRQAANE